MIEPTRWPEHIVACIKASAELGPDVKFYCKEAETEDLSFVIRNINYAWVVSPPPKPDIEQWGNEYNQADSSGNSIISWHNTLGGCVSSRTDSTCISMHHRIIDGATGKLKLSDVMSIFEGKVKSFKVGVGYTSGS